MCIVVTIEVLTNSINEWNLEVVERSFRKGNWGGGPFLPMLNHSCFIDYSAGLKNGYPIWLAWCVKILTINIV